MNNRKWIKLVLLFSLLNIVFLGIVNYISDPFNVFHTTVFKKQFQMNERFMKIEYLEENFNKYNSYMFGSSRIGTTTTKTVEKYIPNSKFYNLSVQNTNLYDHLMHLKYFVKRKYSIENLYLQLDITDMASYGNDGSRYLIKLHPYVKGEPLSLFYLQYLTGVFYKNIQEKIKLNINNQEYDKTMYLDTGIWIAPKREEAISENCKEYVKHEETFNAGERKKLVINNLSQIKSSLSEIKNICKKHNIHLYVFIASHNKNMMDLIDLKSYISFLKVISEVKDYYDFSGYNSIAIDNCNFYDYGHYRPYVGSLIAAKIFNDASIPVPDDFGTLVTKDNIDSYIIEKEKNMKKYRFYEK